LNRLGFLPDFSYLFTIQVAFLPYCPYLNTYALLPYHFTIQPTVFSKFPS
jgi:hypothetical protein